MEKFNRAVRRHHAARLKKKRRHYWCFGYPDYRYPFELREPTAKQLGLLVATPQVCSCPSCGNQRKYLGKTLQELSFEALNDSVEI